MAQKNLELELNLASINPNNWHEKYVYTSMINPKYSQTQRSEKYIPLRFRDKHNNAYETKPSDKFKTYNSNYSFFQTNSYKRNPASKKNKQGSVLLQEDNKSNEQCRKMPFLPIKKACTLKEMEIDIPKLRETNSTKCQSPKASPIKNYSKVNQFIKIRLLGRGKFGDVYLVKHKMSGFIGALKIIQKRDMLCGSQEENQKSIAQLIRQIKLQAYLQHPNLISLYDFFADQQRVYLLLELACDGHLYSFLQANQAFSQQTTSIIVRQITEGVDYMHRKDIIHRDIKLQNIVLCHGMAKICDFGWSVYCPRQFRTTICGTPLYLSPQILIGKQYNKKIDTWAIGALTHELYTGQNPFKIKNKDDLSKIVTEDFEMEKGSAQLRSFVTFILRKNPNKRPDADTIKRHPFIEKYRGLQTSQELCYLVNKIQSRSLQNDVVNQVD